MTSSSWPAGRSRSPTPTRSRAWPVGVQDRPDRRLGAGRVGRPRAGPGDLAAHPRGPSRAGAGTVAAAPGAPRVALKHRVQATLLGFGRPGPTSDRFGSGGRQLLDRLRLPEPWAGTTAAAVALIDDLDEPVPGGERELRHLGADHAEGPLLMTAPASPGSWATRSPLSWATSPGSRRPRSCAAIPACARGWTSPGRGTIAGRWPRTAPSPAVGADRGRHPCRPSSRRPRPGDQAAARPAARPGGRPRPARPQLAEAIWHLLTTQAPFRPARPRQRLWPHDGPQLRWASRTLRSDLILPPRRRYRDEHPTTTGHQVSPDDQPLTSRPSS